MTRLRIRPYEALYRNLVFHTGRRKKLLNLTYEEFLEFTEVRECHYCGAAIGWCESNRHKNGSRYNLDEKDSTAGYTKENLVVCCLRCNKAKSNLFTYEQFLKIAAVIRTF